jgi:glycine C-acetyltransferase
MVGDAAKAFEFSRVLFEEGVLATGIGYPTVPQGKARIRAIVTAAHTEGQLDDAVEIFRRVARRLQIIP